MYITLPILGSMMAAVFYLIIRGGFFPQAQIGDTNPLGFVAMAALIGMFTEQAAEKLRQIAETFFTTAPKGANHVGLPTIAAIKPNHGKEKDVVEITGTGFAGKPTVKFGSTAASQVTFDAPTLLRVEVPAGSGTCTVEVTNPDGQKASKDKAFTYDP